MMCRFFLVLILSIFIYINLSYGKCVSCYLQVYTIKQNDSVEVKRYANQSTGFRRVIVKQIGESAVLLSSEYRNTAVGLPYIGGEEVWKFKGLLPGVSEYILIYNSLGKGSEKLIERIVINVN